MQSIPHLLSFFPNKRTVSFAPTDALQDDAGAIQRDKKKVDRLFLQSDVAFVVDISYALSLFNQAKSIINDRSFTDQETCLKLSSREKLFQLYGLL